MHRVDWVLEKPLQEKDVVPYYTQMSCSPDLTTAIQDEFPGH